MPPASSDQILTQTLRRLWPDGVPVDAGTIDTAPPDRGAYLLAIHLDDALDIPRSSGPWHLPAGWYVYAGSARGPGGIGARLRHHFRREKRAHWHVDHLTLRATAIHALALEGGAECEIVAGLLGTSGFTPGPAGFGSSDCTCCPAHLLIAGLE